VARFLLELGAWGAPRGGACQDMELHERRLANLRQTNTTGNLHREILSHLEVHQRVILRPI